MADQRSAHLGSQDQRSFRLMSHIWVVRVGDPSGCCRTFGLSGSEILPAILNS